MPDKDLEIGIKTTADTSGAKEAVEAVKELNEVQRDFQERKEAFDARMEAKRAGGTNTGGPGSSGANPFTDGSQLAVGKPDEIKETTAAIEEQEKALEDLTDAEAGVIDATKRINEESDKPSGGFKALFDQQRLMGIGRELEKLGGTVRELVGEFLKTDAAKDMLAGLSDETRTFGGVALGVASGVAQGFAQGGPIGAALGGLNAVLKETAGAWIEANQRIQASNDELAKAEETYSQRATERRREAADQEIEKQLDREKNLLDDQNESLRTQNQLWDARKEAARSVEELEAARVERDGGDVVAQKRKQIDAEERRRMIDLKVERDQLAKEDSDAAKKRDDAAEAAKAIAESRGTDSDEYRAARRTFEEADAERRRVGGALPGRLNAIRDRERAVLNDSETSRVRLDDDRLDDELRKRREQQQEARQREEESRRRTVPDDNARRGRLGLEGEGIADQAGRATNKIPGAADKFEKLGNDLAKNPTADAADRLGDALEKVAGQLEGREDALSRKLRGFAERVDRLEAKLKTTGDGK